MCADFVLSLPRINVGFDFYLSKITFYTKQYGFR